MTLSISNVSSIYWKKKLRQLNYWGFEPIRAIAGFLLSVLGVTGAFPSEPLSFRNDVMAVLSKAGCNAGGCHGNASGKAGFKLSLRGQDPDRDFQILTRDLFGRRINPVDPDQSLILLKPTAEIPHEGGKRFSADSWEYRTLRIWIASGAREDPLETPVLESISAVPEERILVEPEIEIPLRITARFSDGSERDVTDVAVYETVNSIATVTPGGLVHRQIPGETTVLVRYLNQQVAVRLAFVPSRPDFRWEDPAENNYVDKHVFAKLRRLHLNPSTLSTDEVFLRRASLDLLGILPTAEDALSFVNDSRSDKRARVIDQLLQRSEFSDFWALKWSDLLRNEERTLDQKGVENFHHWIRQSIADGTPVNEFVHQIISARGSTYRNPASNFYRANRNPIERAEAVAQVFLGTRLRCAQCHNHPFDRWTQNDYYSWASVFSKIQYKVLENRRQDSNDSHEFKGEQIVFVSRKGTVNNPRTGKRAEPRFLGATESNGDRDNDALSDLARWITSEDNTFFAKTQVNRIWYQLFGRGIVDPIDDFRATNPASHPRLLEALTADFIEHQFDLRHMIRTIMNSRTYQLSSIPNGGNHDDAVNYSHAFVRRLSAEQLLDNQSRVLGMPAKFQGYPIGMRAGQLPGAKPEKVRRGRRSKETADQFLALFGKPLRLLTCEYERSDETTMSQAFQLISGPTLNNLLTVPENRLAELLDSGNTPDEIIDQLYWSALTRAPTGPELERAVAHLEASDDSRFALEDIVWGLLNAKEFLLRK